MIKYVKDYLKLSSSDAALIISPENRFYFTDFASSDGFLLVSADRAVFITDGRYIEAAQKTIKNCEVMLQSQTISQIKDVLTALGAKSVAVEAERMTLFATASLILLLIKSEALKVRLRLKKSSRLKELRKPRLNTF